MNNYQMTKTLGEGSFAIVYEGPPPEGQYPPRSKKLKTSKSRGACLSMRELRSLKSLGKHPNLVHLRELIIDQQTKYLYFVFEFLPKDLHKVIQGARSTGGFSDARAGEMCAGLLSGVGHMHARGFMHRDLKPENILCDESGTKLKIADLGLAREIRSRHPYTEYVATRWYRAPELS